jgi:alkylated DNA nucleotide flippase Atl1
MIETFRACKRAYELAFIKGLADQEPERLAVVCKHFILRALAQINKGKITSITQVQKYMGQHWPADQVGQLAVDKDDAGKAFLYIYKTLLRYVVSPYAPQEARVVGAALKVRARVPHVRVYLEDTLDLVLWYPQQLRLEFVDFQIQPAKAFDPAWPSADLLVKKFLAERLKTRWPFERLSITGQRVGIDDFSPINLNLEETTFRLHWREIVKNLEQMKEFESSDSKDYGPHPHGACRHCHILETRSSKFVQADDTGISLTA